MRHRPVCILYVWQTRGVVGMIEGREMVRMIDMSSVQWGMLWNIFRRAQGVEVSRTSGDTVNGDEGPPGLDHCEQRPRGFLPSHRFSTRASGENCEAPRLVDHNRCACNTCAKTRTLQERAAAVFADRYDLPGASTLTLRQILQRHEKY